MTSSKNTMDPELWSNLQCHISLGHVFSKMMCPGLYRLRSVCKEWNSMGKQQLGFSNGFRNPFFVIVYPVNYTGSGPYHTGILSLHIASGQWRWKPLHITSSQLDPLYAPFSMNGLIFYSSERWSERSIYDIHTKEYYRYRNLEQNMAEMGTERPRVVAMAVDTSVTPFQNKIVLGSLTTDTRVFCGNESESKPSRIPAITSKRWPSYYLKSCLQCNDHVYVWWQTTMIQVYSLKEDKWTALNPPENSGDHGGALGAWNNRLFVVVKDGQSSVCVWELVEESKQMWKQFARMPGEMYAWLVPDADDSTHVFASFYNYFVLMYTVLDKTEVNLAGISDNFVMFNLESKQWEKMSLWDKLDGDIDCHLEDTRLPRYDSPDLKKRKRKVCDRV